MALASLSSHFIGKTDFVNAGLNLGYITTGVLISGCAAYTAYDISSILPSKFDLSDDQKKMCRAISSFLAGTAATYLLAPAHTMQTMTIFKTLQVCFLTTAATLAYFKASQSTQFLQKAIVPCCVAVSLSALPTIGGYMGSKAVITAGAITAFGVTLLKT